MKISCPHCGQHYSVPESYVGSTVTCTKCNNDFVVEKPVEHMPPIAPKYQDIINPPPKFKTPILASIFFASGIILWIMASLCLIGGFVMKTSPMIFSGIGMLFAGLVQYGIGQVLSAVGETAHNSRITAENSQKIVQLIEEIARR